MLSLLRATYPCSLSESLAATLIMEVARVQEFGKQRGEQTELTQLKTVIAEGLPLSCNSIEACSSLSGRPIEVKPGWVANELDNHSPSGLPGYCRSQSISLTSAISCKW
jgi:hypothetical protein